MKTAIFSFSHTPFLSTTLLAAAFLIPFNLSLAAQQPPSNSVDAPHSRGDYSGQIGDRQDIL